MGQNRSKGCVFPGRIGFLAFLFGIVLFGIMFLLINISRNPQAQVGPVTAALTVIPSLGGTLTPTVSAANPSDQPELTPTLVPGEIGVSAFVTVSGTGGDGLRLRKGPGLGYEMQFLGLDGELFQIGDGPDDADGYTWWFVVGSYDESRQGWAVADFLEFVPNP